MIRDETLSRRLTLVGVVLIGISLVLLVRLLSFQFRMNPEIKQALEDQAKNRYQQTVEVLPKRGQIFDRNGHLLATNSFEYRIGISPNQVVDRQAVAIALAPLVGLPENRLYDLLQPNADGTFPPYVLLASRVSAEVGQAIADLSVPGIIIEPLPIRIYPQGELTAQVVGFFAGSDGARASQGYYGVEGYYQTLLAGQSKRVTKSNIPLLEESQTQATRVRDGMDLILTIDRDLQYLAQEVLMGFLEKDPTATGGTILIMNPRNGEILAMANYPYFQPGDLSEENMKYARNQAVADVYEPGSVFKVVTMALALDAGTHDLDWSYYDPGCFEAGGVAICNWDRTSHGNPDFAQVFIDSLNTGTATIYKEIGPYTVYPKLREFGIGSPTGVDLEGESPGILVEPGDPLWSEAQFLNNSYGQGVSVTPLQMLTAANAIANDGLIMQPHIVKARIDSGQVIETQPAATHRPISEEAAHKARDIMVRVLRESNEIEFEFPGYTIAGKTGTAEIPAPYGYEPFAPGNSIASFLAFLPADDPVVSILIKLDRPWGYWGSLTAAPLAQELLERLVVLMEIPPDNLRYQLVAQGGNPLAREY
ncbi:MAG: penicillin-binding protein 2 [Chloroflexota bacterium]|jgi:cell division protein FtsI/penicillin-binding protein 2